MSVIPPLFRPQSIYSFSSDPTWHSLLICTHPHPSHIPQSTHILEHTIHDRAKECFSLLFPAVLSQFVAQDRTTCEPGRTSPCHAILDFVCCCSSMRSRKSYVKYLVIPVFSSTQILIPAISSRQHMRQPIPTKRIALPVAICRANFFLLLSRR